QAEILNIELNTHFLLDAVKRFYSAGRSIFEIATLTALLSTILPATHSMFAIFAQDIDRCCGELLEPQQNSGISDLLLLPIMIHLHRSQRWTTPEQLNGVLAETQRIFTQAGIELQPMFDANDAGTEFLDIYFMPNVQIRGQRVNGISLSRGAREVFVRDDVRLRKVRDCRPAGLLQVLHWPSSLAKPPPVRVSAEEAEQARTLAHEIAHQLGLYHRQDTTNLLSSGTTGWFLNESEIDTMRQFAVSRFGAIAISAATKPS
ncbi:MAG: hypothetical protein AAF974_07880, partial [Cyanobacteria bacterium P01_E01_bin.34]